MWFSLWCAFSFVVASVALRRRDIDAQRARLFLRIGDQVEDHLVNLVGEGILRVLVIRNERAVVHADIEALVQRECTNGYTNRKFII